MKNLFLLCTVILAFSCNSSKKNTHVIDDAQSPRVLYVINAKSGTYEKDKLQLQEIPSVIYFSDRPKRLAGHMSLEQFVKIWKKGDLKKDPPNGALSLIQSDKEITVELMDPEVKEKTISFKTKIINGKIPPKFESAALFIDFASPHNQYFAYEPFKEDFHALDCSCAAE